MNKNRFFLVLAIAILSLAAAGIAMAANPNIGSSQSENPGPASVLNYNPTPGVSQPEPSQPDAWTNAASYPQTIARYAHVQCQGDFNTFYIFGGVSEGSIVSSARRYNADINIWTDLAPMPFFNEAPAGACLDGKIYVTEGDNGTHFNIYDIASNTWAQGAIMPRESPLSMIAAWEGKVYLIGGDDDFNPSTGVSDQVNIYDVATDMWTTGAAMPTGESAAGFVQLGRYVYIAGGWDTTIPNNTTLTQRYDMLNDTWQTGPAFVPARADFALAATNQYIYALGGDQTGGGYFDSSNTVWRYAIQDWPGGNWSDVGDNLPFGVSAYTGGFTTNTITGGEIWSVGGIDGSTFTFLADNLYRAAEPPWNSLSESFMPIIFK